LVELELNFGLESCPLSNLNENSNIYSFQPCIYQCQNEANGKYPENINYLKNWRKTAGFGRFETNLKLSLFSVSCKNPYFSFVMRKL